MKRTIGVAGLLALVAGAVFTRAESPFGVTPRLVGRGTYDAFKVKSDSFLFEFEAEAKPAVDIVVREHTYAVDSSTGWHTHPGPVFITVTEGKLMVYEVDDPTCTGKELKKGEGYVDTGQGHVVRNESGQAAKDVTVIIAPVGLPFRGELPAPGPYCDF